MRVLLLLLCLSLALATRQYEFHKDAVRTGKPIPLHIPVQDVNSTDTFEVPYWLGAFYAVVDEPADWFLPVTIGNGGATYPGEFLYVRNYGPEDITLYTTSPETIEGTASYTISSGTVVEILSGYPNWVVVTPFSASNVTCGVGMSCAGDQVSLATVGTAGTTAYPTSITTNSYGQITSITPGPAPLTAIPDRLDVEIVTSSCWLGVGTNNPTNKQCGDTTTTRLWLDSSASSTAAPVTILATPMSSTQAYRIGGMDGSGFQASPGSRTVFYARESMQFFGGRDTTTAPTYQASSPSDASFWFSGTTNTRPVIRIAPSNGQTANIMEIRTNGSATSLVDVVDNGGHFGLAGKTNPANAWIYIGTGTGTLVDAPTMGIKVKLDTTPATAPTGIQSNVNIVPSTGSINLRGAICSRLDISDATSSGVGVSIWADTFVSAPSRINTWGANIYTQIGAPTSPGTVNYTGVSVGAEIGIFNFGVNQQIGGGLSMVMGGTAQVRFGILLKSGGYPDSNFGLNSTQNAQHFILASDDTVTDALISGRGPAVNFIYYGPLAANNAPTGTPKFKVDAAGNMFATSIASSSTNPALQAFGAVTAEAASGVLAFTVSTAAATCATAVVTNTKVASTSQVQLTIQSYTGTPFTNGNPTVARVDTAGSSTGSFTLQLCNMHATNALSGNLYVGFWVLN